MKIKDFWNKSNPNKNFKSLGLIVDLTKFINENIALFLEKDLDEIGSKNTRYLPDPEYTKKLTLLKKLNPNRSAELVHFNIRIAQKIEIISLDFEFSDSLRTPTLSLSGRLSFNVQREYNYENTSYYFTSTKVKIHRDIDVILNVFDHQILEDMYLDYMTV